MNMYAELTKGKKDFMRSFFIVLFSVLIVFAYASADNAVSPLVTVFQNFFHVPQVSVLYLISSCTLGIVVGSFIGPELISKYTPAKILLYSVILLSLSTALFVKMDIFYAAIIFRFIFGVCCGFLNCIIWWITFHGVSGKTTDLMVAITVASRPIAMCLGIPLVGIITSLTSWQVAYVFLVIILLLSAGVLFFFFKSPKAQIDNQIKKVKSSFLKPYLEIFNLPYSFRFYFGLTLNSFCYFGFYAFAGIWFMRHYQLNFLHTSLLFFLLGGAEVAASFLAGWIYRVLPYDRTFTAISLAAILLFPIFIYGYFPLYITVGLIMLFILANRAVIFAMVRTLPIVFSSPANKTPLGALITLSIWLGFALVSGLQGKLMPYIGINAIETILVLALIFGMVLIFVAQSKTVFVTIKKLG